MVKIFIYFPALYPDVKAIFYLKANITINKMAQIHNQKYNSKYIISKIYIIIHKMQSKIKAIKVIVKRHNKLALIKVILQLKYKLA
jgi:hypothetical protein